MRSSPQKIYTYHQCFVEILFHNQSGYHGYEDVEIVPILPKKI
jgi:hypothetical protein